MILITMTVAEQAISFEGLLGASHTLIVALGTVAAGHEMLATFEGAERLALDAVLRVVGERIDHFASLLKSNMAANVADPTEATSGTLDGFGAVGAEAESLLRPVDRRTSWVLPSDLGHGSLAPELSNAGNNVAATGHHVNGSVATVLAVNGHEADTTLLASRDAEEVHTPEPPGITDNINLADGGDAELTVTNPGDAAAIPGPEPTDATAAGEPDGVDEPEVKEVPDLASRATAEPLPDPAGHVDDTEPAVGATGGTDSETAAGDTPGPGPVEAKPPKPNGRLIERIEDDKLAAFNKSRQPVYVHDKATSIRITGDKTYEVNGKVCNLRVPADGAPSTVMQVLNIVLTGQVAGKNEFTKLEIEEIIDDKFLTSGSVGQAVKRLLESGFLERRNVSGGETVFGMPKFVEVADIRNASVIPSAREGTKSFLVQAARVT